jgi:hypothetical protein
MRERVYSAGKPGHVHGRLGVATCNGRPPPGREEQPWLCARRTPPSRDTSAPVTFCSNRARRGRALKSTEPLARGCPSRHQIEVARLCSVGTVVDSDRGGGSGGAISARTPTEGRFRSRQRQRRSDSGQGSGGGGAIPAKTAAAERFRPGRPWCRLRPEISGRQLVCPRVASVFQRAVSRALDMTLPIAHMAHAEYFF